MKAGNTLRAARRRARLTQRQLALRSGLHQSALARIESGRVVPRVDTLDRLLRVCGERLDAVPMPADDGVDVSQIRERLSWSVQDRLNELIAGAEALNALRGSAR